MQIAFALKENIVCGRLQSLWVTSSRDLKFEVQADLCVVKCDVGVHAVTVVHTSHRSAKNSPIVLFATYNDLVPRKPKAVKLTEIVNFLGGTEFEGCGVRTLRPHPSLPFSIDLFTQIVFDECHKAKNYMSSATEQGKSNEKKKQCSKIGKAVVELQDLLPNARVLYVSATGATDVCHLGYMTRLGLWGQSRSFRDRKSVV